MRLDDQQESSNVEDQRGGMSPLVRGSGLGCGGLIVILVLSYFTGIDPRRLLQSVEDASPPPSASTQSGPGLPQGNAGDALGHFSAKVLGSTEQAWSAIFAASGSRYSPPTMVLFTGAVQSACGRATAAVGPFYCPGDRKLYLDTDFFRELDRLGGRGDFARAYVIAHEVGHHVQNLLGIEERVERAQGRAGSEQEVNRYSVRMELQADCLAGVWGSYAQRAGIIEPGDFESGLAAAASIGDDRLQRLARGYVSPESFTHGSSQQRVESLRRGLQSGNPAACSL